VLKEQIVEGRSTAMFGAADDGSPFRRQQRQIGLGDEEYGCHV
jgi:hypothetical protein